MADLSPVITIDGPSGSGKGTVARALAARFGWHLLDSGALYRGVALAALGRGVSLDDESALAEIAAALPIRFADGGNETLVYLDEADVSLELRTETTGDAASRVARWPAVRTALLGLQRSFAGHPGLVADGRDMGTVVFPSASAKYFLTASPEARADRRYKQLKGKGFTVNLAALAAEISERDERDGARLVAPLKAADDAVTIDSTALDSAAVVAAVLADLAEKGIAH